MPNESVISTVDTTLLGHVNVARVMQRLDELAQVGRHAHGVTRLAFSDEDRQARAKVVAWMREAGLACRVDPIGNLIGRSPSHSPHSPAVMIGSHIDTVVNAGNFDGILGVVASIEVVHAVAASGWDFKHPLEVVCFVMEESSRFGVGYGFGSSVMTGQIAGQAMLLARDQGGKSLADALYEMRMAEDPSLAVRGAGPLETAANWIEQSCYPPNRIEAFVELHIEQGPVLDAAHKSIGVVTVIAAPTRFTVSFTGMQSHSGTTPMHLRKDALAAAAEFILAVEQVCTQSGEVVGSVGMVRVQPNVLNVIPGQADVGVDLRSASAPAKRAALDEILDQLASISARRGIATEIKVLADETPCVLSEDIILLIEKNARGLGHEHLRLPSGAGHDAAHIAKLVPNTGMLFVPSRNGISHNPQEWTDEADIRKGIEVYLLTVADLLQRQPDRGAR